jgi:Zn-dependent protease with chaperone function
MYILLGISLALAFLLGVNLLVAFLSTAVWRAAGSSVAGFPARLRAQVIFGLRILPVAAAVVFVSVFVVPAYLLYEPASSGEVVSTKLAIIASVSSLAVAFAFFRVIRTWLATRFLIADWLKSGEPIKVQGVQIPVYRFDHRFPVVAVIGIFRPRLFVAHNVLETLTEAEFYSAVAHEYGHLDASDNLKRTLLRACRDLVIFPFGKQLDEAWANTAEIAADDFAAISPNGASALDLASALVKIAKLVSSDTPPAVPAAAFLIGENAGDITERVRHLINMDGQSNYSREWRPLGISIPFWLWTAVFAVLILLPLADSRVLPSIQSTTEHLVAALQ